MGRSMSTPTTEEVRAAIAAFTVMPPNARAVTPAQFDAWLEAHDEEVRSAPLDTFAEPVGTLRDAADRVAGWLHILDNRNPMAAMSLQADDLRRLVDHARKRRVVGEYGGAVPPNAEERARVRKLLEERNSSDNS